MKYLYIQKTRLGWRIYRDIPETVGREGCHYIYCTKKQAVAAFRRDFDCRGKHFIKIET